MQEVSNRSSWVVLPSACPSAQRSQRDDALFLVDVLPALPCGESWHYEYPAGRLARLGSAGTRSCNISLQRYCIPPPPPAPAPTPAPATASFSSPFSRVWCALSLSLSLSFSVALSLSLSLFLCRSLYLSLSISLSLSLSRSCTWAGRSFAVPGQRAADIGRLATETWSLLRCWSRYSPFQSGLSPLNRLLDGRREKDRLNKIDSAGKGRVRLPEGRGGVPTDGNGLYTTTTAMLAPFVLCVPRLCAKRCQTTTRR